MRFLKELQSETRNYIYLVGLMFLDRSRHIEQLGKEIINGVFVYRVLFVLTCLSFIQVLLRLGLLVHAKKGQQELKSKRVDLSIKIGFMVVYLVLLNFISTTYYSYGLNAGYIIIMVMFCAIIEYIGTVIKKANRKEQIETSVGYENE